MTIQFTDNHLEAEVEAERDRRGDTSKTKTTKDLLRERIAELRLLRSLGMSESKQGAKQ